MGERALPIWSSGCLVRIQKSSGYLLSFGKGENLVHRKMNQYEGSNIGTNPEEPRERVNTDMLETEYSWAS